MNNLLRVEDGQMKVFGMDVPKALVLGVIMAVLQYCHVLTGDPAYTLLIAMGIQKGGDSLSDLVTKVISK